MWTCVDIKIGKWSIEGSGLLFFVKSVYLFLLNIGKLQHPEIRLRKLNNKGNFNPLYNIINGYLTEYPSIAPNLIKYPSEKRFDRVPFSEVRYHTREQRGSRPYVPL